MQAPNTKKRVAVYARYSTDLQNDRSIEDQFEVCKTYARRNGWADCLTFADRAASGASEFGRPNYAQMMEAARRGEFDIILSEDLDPVFPQSGQHRAIARRYDLS